jgi:hypothetical protein
MLFRESIFLSNRKPVLRYTACGIFLKISFTVQIRNICRLSALKRVI